MGEDSILKKEDFDKSLRKIGLSRVEFAAMTNIAYSTVGNWHDDKKPVPGWVESWLENYVKAKIADEVVKVVEFLLPDKKV